MSLSATAKWILLALAGLAIAIAIAIAAAHLTSQQIGIASESVSAGDALAPALNIPGKGKTQEGGNANSGQEGATTVPSYTPPAITTEEPPFPPEEPSGTPGDQGGGGSGDSDGDDD